MWLRLVPGFGAGGATPNYRREPMPYVNIKITKDPKTTPEQKAALIKGTTEVLVAVLNKNPAGTFIVIDEVEREDWGVGGVPVSSKS